MMILISFVWFGGTEPNKIIQMEWASSRIHPPLHNVFPDVIRRIRSLKIKGPYEGTFKPLSIVT
jgi:hypothetical protein